MKTSAAPEIDPRVIAALRTAFAAQRTKGSDRALLDPSIGGNVLPFLELEAVYPSRIRLKRSGMETIFVDGKGMVRRGDKWTAAPSALAKSLGAIDDSQEDEKLLENTTYAKNLGQTKVDDRVPSRPPTKTIRRGKSDRRKRSFISLDDGLIRRIDSQGEVQGRALIPPMMVGDCGSPIQIELPK